MVAGATHAMSPTRVVCIGRDPHDVYIGRAGRGHDGYFGNPFRIVDGDRAGCIEQFRRYFLDRLALDPVYRARVEALRGQTLGCFCAPNGGLTAEDHPMCHGQVYAAWLDGREDARPGPR